MKIDEKRKSQWYFGGIATTSAILITHPIDRLKFLYQGHCGNLKMDSAFKILRKEGIYNGVSASLLRQITYSTTRFASYEYFKNNFWVEGDFKEKVISAGISGMLGGMIGTPIDLVNLKMKGDMLLPDEQKRKYKNCFDGLIKIYSSHGFSRLFSSVSSNTARGCLMNIGQVAIYEETKDVLISTTSFENNIKVHILSSVIAGSVAALLTQPFEVLRTRNWIGTSKTVIENCIELGLCGFYTGYFFSVFRLVPQSVITFIFIEQMRNFSG